MYMYIKPIYPSCNVLTTGWQPCIKQQRDTSALGLLRRSWMRGAFVAVLGSSCDRRSHRLTQTSSGKTSRDRPVLVKREGTLFWAMSYPKSE